MQRAPHKTAVTLYPLTSQHQLAFNCPDITTHFVVRLCGSESMLYCVINALFEQSAIPYLVVHIFFIYYRRIFRQNTKKTQSLYEVVKVIIAYDAFCNLAFQLLLGLEMLRMNYGIRLKTAPTFG